ncbi:MAG: hypothetical protein K0Q61_1697, partial [Rhodococcus erythropolis]|nr:hypothetical protein [Rhodococcus erythropolis]
MLGKLVQPSHSEMVALSMPPPKEWNT